MSEYGSHLGCLAAAQNPQGLRFLLLSVLFYVCHTTSPDIRLHMQYEYSPSHRASIFWLDLWASTVGGRASTPERDSCVTYDTYVLL